MKRIIFVPGKNRKPPPEVHTLLLERSLLEGVRRCDPDIANEISNCNAFSIVAWNHLLYDDTRPISLDKPWVERLIKHHDRPAPERTRSNTGKYYAARLMYQAGDLFPWLISLIPDPRIKKSIQETRRYFENHDNVACHIRQAQKEPLRAAAKDNDKILLIAHSMGSVIAYDSLWELDHLENLKHCVDCLLTIGSPLGMRYVQSRLLGQGASTRQRYPRNIRRWVNISAHGDLVALDQTLENDFIEMLENSMIEEIKDIYKDVYNTYHDDKGMNVHKSYGYLMNPKVSAEICNWWQNA